MFWRFGSVETRCLVKNTTEWCAVAFTLNLLLPNFIHLETLFPVATCIEFKCNFYIFLIIVKVWYHCHLFYFERSYLDHYSSKVSIPFLFFFSFNFIDIEVILLILKQILQVWPYLLGILYLIPPVWTAV